jgi:hypothetical protein
MQCNPQFVSSSRTRVNLQRLCTVSRRDALFVAPCTPLRAQPEKSFERKSMTKLLAALVSLAFAGTVLAQNQPAPTTPSTPDAPKAESPAADKPAAKSTPKKSAKKKSSKAKSKAPAKSEEKKS